MNQFWEKITIAAGSWWKSKGLGNCLLCNNRYKFTILVQCKVNLTCYSTQRSYCSFVEDIDIAIMRVFFLCLNQDGYKPHILKSQITSHSTWVVKHNHDMLLVAYTVIYRKTIFAQYFREHFILNVFDIGPRPTNHWCL